MSKAIGFFLRLADSALHKTVIKGAAGFYSYSKAVRALFYSIASQNSSASKFIDV